VRGASSWGELEVSSGGGFSILGYAARSDTGIVTITGTIPSDNTVPQVAEGSELLTVTVTVPASASYLYFLVNNLNWAEPSNHSNLFTIALFRDGAGNSALAASAQDGAYGSNAGTMTALWRIASPGAGTYTFRIRGGLDGGSTYINAPFYPAATPAPLAGNLNQMNVVVAAQ
jgi:hypothetical protein